MRRAATFFGILAFISLIAIGPRIVPGRPSRFNYGRLKVGMSPAKAESIMGKPTGTAYEAGGMWLEWYDQVDFYSARFNGQSLAEKTYYHSRAPG